VILEIVGLSPKKACKTIFAGTGRDSVKTTAATPSGMHTKWYHSITWTTRLGIREGHSKCQDSIESLWLPIGVL